MRNELKSIYDLEISPRVLIEANAGTGKTYTIVGIYIRLILEKNLAVDQILAVTFTKKATAELRGRILERLRECLRVAETGEPRNDDDFLSNFAQRIEDRKATIARLRSAIQNFDDSQVFTIHGFCQKVLQEEALTAGTPFEMEVNPNDTLYETATADFWRRFIDTHSGCEAGRYLITKLMNIASTPAKFLQYRTISSLFEKSYAVVEGECFDDPVAYLQEVIHKKNELKEIWQSGKDEIVSILKNCDVQRYQSKLDDRIRRLEAFFNDDSFSEDVPEKFEFFTSDYLEDPAKLRKNGSPVPAHPFFERSGSYLALISDMEKVETTLIRDATTEIRQRREILSKTGDSFSYNDLLVNIRNALEDPARGEALATRLRNRFPVALVDEFQDTDPVQYDIFSSIYPAAADSSSLMMIGDPKQAIYAFRGADLYTYFRAKEEGVDIEYTLQRNFRSSVPYIRSVNYLFSGQNDPFIETEIEFSASLPGLPDFNDLLCLSGQKQAPMKIMAKRGVESSKDNACDFAFEQTVSQICKLLGSTAESDAYIGEKPLKPGDIAILVSRNKDAAELKRRLKKRGIDSVTKTNQNIFESLEARKLEMLMNAVLNPSDNRTLNAALLTGCFGQDLRELYQFKEDENIRQDLVEELMELQGAWRSHGFYTMFYKLVHSKNRLLNFAELEGAERTITNLYQLADLCARAESDKQLGPAKLHTWLLRQMEETSVDEKELQLESDQHLVKIMTIHASKGLQFPVVFCPTLWMGLTPSSFQNRPKKTVEYHDPQTNQLYINYDRKKTEQRIEAERASDLESIAEDVRKIYVSLTRARISTYIIWDTHTHSHFSGLGAALLGRETVRDSIKTQLKLKEGRAIDDSTFLKRFEELQNISSGDIQIVYPDGVENDSPAAYRQDGAGELSFEPYQGRQELQIQHRLDSFTSLAGHTSDPAQPDHDQLIEAYAAPFDDPSSVERSSERNIYTFPKGATAGTAIHKLFEHEDFAFDKVDSADYSGLAEEILREYRFDPAWATILVKMLGEVAGCDIPGLNLSKISSRDQLREMEFNFPARTADPDSLVRAIRNNEQTEPLENLRPRYLTGFIDLIVRQKNRYFIVDYKSNYLGDSPQDYSAENLAAEIKNASYDLQYHLYTVALVKYLKKTVPDFNYENHFGGVAYLFVRGIEAGSDNGIWFHKPDIDTITNLEKLISRA